MTLPMRLQVWHQKLCIPIFVPDPTLKPKDAIFLAQQVATYQLRKIKNKKCDSGP